MESVYLLQHSYELEDCEETKIIGLFSSEQSAKDAIQKYKTKPGFSDYPNNFYIDKYEIDKCFWEEGFITMKTIYMPLINEGTKVYRPVEAKKRIDGNFEIVSENINPEDEEWEYSKGDVVRCEIKELENQEKHQVIVEKIIKTV